ncbi:MAG: hypothetical protein ACR2MA_10470 [Egibacteraceae bacterium]
MSAAETVHRILLIREEDAGHSGSGCCGRLGSADSELGGAADFSGNRCRMEAMGAVYRELRQTFPKEGVELHMVDPRNTLWLVPAIWRDARRRGLPWSAAARQVARGVNKASIVVDGRVLYAGEVPEPEEAVDAVLEELGRRA